MTGHEEYDGKYGGDSEEERLIDKFNLDGRRPIEPHIAEMADQIEKAMKEADGFSPGLSLLRDTFARFSTKDMGVWEMWKEAADNEFGSGQRRITMPDDQIIKSLAFSIRSKTGEAQLPGTSPENDAALTFRSPAESAPVVLFSGDAYWQWAAPTKADILRIARNEVYPRVHRCNLPHCQQPIRGGLCSILLVSQLIFVVALAVCPNCRSRYNQIYKPGDLTWVDFDGPFRDDDWLADFFDDGDNEDGDLLDA